MAPYRTEFIELHNGREDAGEEFDNAPVAERQLLGEAARQLLEIRAILHERLFYCQTGQSALMDRLKKDPPNLAYVVQHQDKIDADFYEFNNSVRGLEQIIAEFDACSFQLMDFYKKSGGWDVSLWIMAEHRNSALNEREEMRAVAAVTAEQYKVWGDGKKVKHGIGALIEISNEQMHRDIVNPPFFHQGKETSANNWRPLYRFDGGQAVAALWAQVDENETIQARVVRKDQRFGRFDAVDMTRWTSQSPEGLVPLEWTLHKAVHSCPGARNVVKPLKCEIDWKRYQYRFYTEYCAHGSLADWIDRVLGSGGQRKITEACYWMIFEKLVECGLAMEQGSVDGPAASGWRQVVHRDLKPMNIFLDAPRQDWPGLVQPKLGDFGMAIVTTPVDPMNPHVYTGPGTPGYLAPEQTSYINSLTREPVDSFHLPAHTNVWGVGAIMRELIDGRIPEENFIAGPDEEDRVSQNSHNRYPHLAALIKSCLRFNPANRPSFANLRLGIYQHARNLKFARNTGYGSMPEEGYKVGTACPGPPDEEMEASWIDSDDPNCMIPRTP